MYFLYLSDTCKYFLLDRAAGGSAVVTVMLQGFFSRDIHVKKLQWRPGSVLSTDSW